MSSTWGSQLRLSLFGEAHGPFVGGTLHDFPAGIPLNLDRILPSNCGKVTTISHAPAKKRIVPRFSAVSPKE